MPTTFANLSVRCILRIAVLFAAPHLYGKEPPTPFTTVNGASGTEFWIAVPPSETEAHPTELLEVIVTSQQATMVEVYDASTGRTFVRQIADSGVIRLTNANGDVSWLSEIRESEQPTAKGIRLRSSYPISVFVLNSKQYTHDGYRAIPTQCWGKDYIAAAYYDYKEFAEWAGGFVVVARERTTVTITLRGNGESEAKTFGGRRINTGIPYDVTLEAGEVYMVRGDGKTRGVFDLTGSSIRSDRPIGVLGFHMKTTMPNLLSEVGGRQHLVEMLPPVSAWGKTHATIEFTRRDSKGPGAGDVFRLVASEPNTRWSVRYYHRATKQLLGQSGGILLKAGDVADISQVSAPAQLTQGFSVWEAEKPVLLMQYACSWTWDRNSNLDPFMVLVPPTDRMVHSSEFVCSGNARFTEHLASLIIEADASSLSYEDDLESITLDGIPLWNHPHALIPALKFSRVTENLHFVVVRLADPDGRHVLRSNDRVRLSGYLVGSAADEAYGWPIAASFQPGMTDDASPPTFVIDTGECGDRAIEALDLGSASSGIAVVGIVPDSSSYNYFLEGAGTEPIGRLPARNSIEAVLRVVNKQRDAFCVFYAQDWADNIVIDSVRYVAPRAVDTLAPVIQRDRTTSTSVECTVYETRNNPPRTIVDCDNPHPQIETGIAAIRVDTFSDSSNIKLDVLTQTRFEREDPDTVIRYRWVAVDSTIAARVVYRVVDWAGNAMSDTVILSGVSNIDHWASPHYRITASPNPCQDYLNLTFPVTTNSAYYVLYDLLGRLVLTGEFLRETDRATIDVRNVLPGTYLIAIMDDQRYRVSTVIVK
ncbi:MAG: T9SS type A sorting domain-containing protein [Ignavibacteria bacterium]|nr:T9SS type A sorting domain-containing protein [Ignavibacteria bacterium]